MALINSLCAMLRTSPFHKENYSRLILTVVVEFYQRCSTRFQELILTEEQKATGTDQKIALAADWAQRPDLHPCLSEIFKISEINTPKKDQLYRQETHLELNFVGENSTVEKNNLIGSTRNLATLGSLYTSLVSGHQTSCLYVAERIAASSSDGSPRHWTLSRPSLRCRCRQPLHSS
jgi:exocyst complex component 4